ncbi:ClpX C4-type zinc finger protein [Achromobacter mucicolens]|uniref:ClpX C4-type zinc finger protein n=1 Tax=Achromobacter mucicolens TaxID=1389922 RepID=UPI00397508DE
MSQLVLDCGPSRPTYRSEMDEPKERRRTKKQAPELHCSFCDKSQYEVRKLIARDGDNRITICDECMEMCNQIINDQSLVETEHRPKALFDYIVRQHEIIGQATDRANKAMGLLNISMPPSTDSQH